MSNEPTPLLEVKNLTKHFPAAHGQKVHAVNGVSFKLERGETLGIVGESGCGKSSMGRTILKVHEPTSGQIIFDGVDITGLSNRKMFPYRKKMQMIFQDPYASLNPRFTVGEIIEEPMIIHNMGTAHERKVIVQELIETVGLKPDHIRRYPHEFSGGQRQRIGIARTLALRPEFIVCDEPISALDVSIQAQVINLLEKLQREKGFSYLFIAHDLEMVHHISHKIGVMYLGNMVELGSSDDVYKKPLHPQHRLLIQRWPKKRNESSWRARYQVRSIRQKDVRLREDVSTQPRNVSPKNRTHICMITDRLPATYIRQKIWHSIRQLAKLLNKLLLKRSLRIF